MNLRKRHEWRLKNRTLLAGQRTLIGGLLRSAVDRPLDPDLAFAAAVQFEEAGADFVEVAIEAFAPGSKRITEAEELRRLVPVLKRLKERLGVPLSIVTDKSAVAERAFEFGAEIVHDPTGLTTDAALGKLVAQHDAGLILGHMRGLPESWSKLGSMKDPAGAVAADLDASLHRARRSGVEAHRIVLDPGLNMGKRREQNVELVAHLSRLFRSGAPVSVEADGPWSVAAALAGANIIRTANVAQCRAATDVADAILEALIPPDAPDTEDSSASRVARPPREQYAPRSENTPPPPARRPDAPFGKRPPFPRDRENPRSSSPAPRWRPPKREP
ncbi:MAG: dihydropteroate synthase [Bryobacteraceae bacterium]|nr:dihydropteroate synthase [Bryobacteraceae bacterium]